MATNNHLLLYIMAKHFKVVLVLGRFDLVEGGETFEEKPHLELHVGHNLPEHQQVRLVYNFQVQTENESMYDTCGYCRSPIALCLPS